MVANSTSSGKLVQKAALEIEFAEELHGTSETSLGHADLLAHGPVCAGFVRVPPRLSGVRERGR